MLNVMLCYAGLTNYKFFPNKNEQFTWFSVSLSVMASFSLCNSPSKARRASSSLVQRDSASSSPTLRFFLSSSSLDSLVFSLEIFSCKIIFTKLRLNLIQQRANKLQQIFSIIKPRPLLSEMRSFSLAPISHFLAALQGRLQANIFHNKATPLRNEVL